MFIAPGHALPALSRGGTLIVARAKGGAGKVLKEALLYIARVPWVRDFVTSHHLLQGLVHRFVAGETLDEAISVVARLNASGMHVSLDYLGENVVSSSDAAQATRAYIDILDAIARHQVDSNISLKLTHLGLDLGEDLCVENLRCIVQRAESYHNFVRIDMESSAYTQRTLAVFERLWSEGYRNLGVVIQAYLHRSEGDLAKLVQMGVRVRLCKGAYSEPSSVAFSRKRDVDANFQRLMEQLLLLGNYPAIATHDERLIHHAMDFARSHGIPPSRFEFQMLYGIRRDLQEALVRDGYNVRVYVPFGSHWYPYLTRRLAERPANLLFFLRALARG